LTDAAEQGGGGELLATQAARGWVAKVKITYDQKAYGVSLVEANRRIAAATRSAGPITNRWLRNIEKDVEVVLTAAGMQSN
jgi:hypothetical protein